MRKKGEKQEIFFSLPVNCHGNRHVDGGRHERVSQRVEKRDDDGEHAQLVGLGPHREGEQEEGGHQEEDVEGCEAAKDLDEVLLQLDVLVVQHADGDRVAQEAEGGDQGQEQRLDHGLEVELHDGGSRGLVNQTGKRKTFINIFFFIPPKKQVNSFCRIRD